MKYKFVIDYTPTDPAGVASQRVCSPTYGDDLAVNIEMESDEWYRKRKLEGKLTFLRNDYEWIMGCAFDGTFKLTVQSSNDGGAMWQNYLEGTFSRANMEIDEDNQRVVLNGLNEGGEYNVIENGKSEEYDLMKIIPDSEAKEVQGEVHPALAMVDYRSEIISQSDMFCDTHLVAGGYKNGGQSEWNIYMLPYPSDKWTYIAGLAEAKVEMKNATSLWGGTYTGEVVFRPVIAGELQVVSVQGTLRNDNYGFLNISVGLTSANRMEAIMEIYDNNGYSVDSWFYDIGINTSGFYSPQSFEFLGDNTSLFKSVSVIFHYIRATLLTQLGGNADNVLNTTDYYKRMSAFNNSDNSLQVSISRRTVEQPNGHRLVPGTGEQGTVPQYFAPPDDQHNYIPLAEYNWNYGSLWYTIEPSVANGLLDPTKVGSFRWTRCWTLGTCLDWLLRKITNNKVTFDQSVAGSEFLYSAVNPLTQGEPFEYLFTQKSNVMRPSLGGEGAARCIVRLDWFLEFLRNALNCYWWLEERNGGTYAFRMEHVEWFRRGGSYTGQMDARFNLTEIKTRRNFPRNGEAAKRLDDQLHKYSYDMNGMTEKYLFSWQGDGGSDDFKGNPMFFKAGWVERGTSESHEVDNIFADLSWLMLNAGSDTLSSKNYDGIFVFGGYNAYDNIEWLENSVPLSQVLVIANAAIRPRRIELYMALTAPEGHEITVQNGMMQEVYVSDGKPMYIHVDVVLITGSLTIDFGASYSAVVLNRLCIPMGLINIYRVPNVLNRLTEDGYLQNGPLAWPWLQSEFLHYDVPAQRWGYKYDDLDALDSHGAWETDGTVKLRKKQEVPLLPLPTKSYEEDLDKGVIGGLKDSQGQLQTGIVKSATINLGTRNATLTLMYDMIS